MKKKLNKTYIRRRILTASIIVGLIAAVAIYTACSFGRCPRNPDKFQFALLFFIIGFSLSYLMKAVYLSAKLKAA